MLKGGIKYMNQFLFICTIQTFVQFNGFIV